jgi:hypothetical protein
MPDFHKPCVRSDGLFVDHGFTRISKTHRTLFLATVEGVNVRTWNHARGCSECGIVQVSNQPPWTTSISDWQYATDVSYDGMGSLVAVPAVPAITQVSASLAKTLWDHLKDSV